MPPVSPRHPARDIRRGISLIAIVVTVMIIAVLAAVAVPYLRESNDQMAAVRTAQIFRTLELDLNNFPANKNGVQGFCNWVGICPQQLQQLTRQITIADLACGGAAYKASQVGFWISAAPYSGLPISPGYGVWTPLGVIHDSVIKVSTGNFELHIDSMSANAAADLAAQIGAQLTTVNTAVNTSGQVLKLAKYSIVVGNAQCP